MYIEQYLGAIETFGAKNALTCLSTNKTLTYRQLDAITNQLSNRFRRDGLKKGDLVMVCLFNTWHFPVTMLGSWKNLQIFSPINFRLSSGEIKNHLEDSVPKIFVYDSDLDETIGKALELSSHKPDIVISTGTSSLKGIMKFDDYIQESSKKDTDLQERLEQIDFAKDEMQRVYTSGTTGFPKGVKFSSQSLLHLACKMLYSNTYNHLDRMMGLTPWFHLGGILTVVQAGLLAGAHIFGLKKFDANKALDYVQDYRLTFLAGAPATFNAMATEQKAKSRELSSLRLIHAMGSPASRREILLWQEIFSNKVANSYGATETGSMLSLQSSRHPIHEKAGSAGRPSIFTRVRVIKLDGIKRAEPEDLVKNDGLETGQVIVRSLGMLDGYHNRPDEECRKMYEGWFYTGDTATVDKDGFITIKGRTDDMFVSGGENIFPQPVEEVLEKHPKVKECVVVGMNDQKWGQVTAAYIVPGNEMPTVEELEEYCWNDPGLSKYKRPRYYKFVNELAYTATGKIMRQAMKERANKEREKFTAVLTRKRTT